jgi:ribosomal protein L23
LDTSNTLTFVVADDATKAEVKKEAEQNWGEKIVSVNTLRTIDGRKKAIIKFERKGAASQIAGKLKLI